MAKTSISEDACTPGIVGALHVADLARRADVTPATVRYYARIGLLKPRRDDHNGYRRFKDEDLRRVIFIRKAQALGLTIADVHTILDTIDHDQPVCDRVIELVQERLDEVRRQCSELEATRLRMENALKRWSRSPRRAGEYCALIEQVELGHNRTAAGSTKSRLSAVSG